VKRFYKDATASVAKSGKYAVLLDDKPIKTKSKQSLEVPTLALAEKVASEWQAQGTEIKPDTMPFMTLSSTTIDSVIPQVEAIALNLAAYGGSDLVCYRAENPDSLIKLQHDAWQPLVAWVKDRYGIRLIVTSGVVHVAQDAASLAKFNDIVLAFDAYRLTVLHEFTTLSGSLVIALAIMDGHITAEEGLERSLVDETFQANFWGADAEADARHAIRQAEFMNAKTFLSLLSVT